MGVPTVIVHSITRKDWWFDGPGIPGDMSYCISGVSDMYLVGSYGRAFRRLADPMGGPYVVSYYLWMERSGVYSERPLGTCSTGLRADGGTGWPWHCVVTP